MTLPNKLTLLRILLVPVMVIIYAIPKLNEIMIVSISGSNFFYGFNLASLLMVIIFCLASITDFLDGHIARKYNLITSFGKFADPLADKMLVFSAMAILLVDCYKYGDWYWNIMPIFVFVIMLIREFMVSGIRMVVATKGVVIPAAKLGKWKTFITMIAIIVMFFMHIHLAIAIAAMALMYIACILTILSGIEYFIKSKDVILESI